MERYCGSIFKLIAMAITIKTNIDKGIILVNGKEVYKDTNGNWIAREELTTCEYQAFKEQLKALKMPLIN